MPDSTSFTAGPYLPPHSFAVSPLRLRVIGTERHGQTVEVKGNRCTVGSAASCTLRLRAAGVHPLHCLIVQGVDGLVVRSLSSETYLNGLPFREQSLRVSDRLRFGPIELEVLGESIGAPVGGVRTSGGDTAADPAPAQKSVPAAQTAPHLPGPTTPPEHRPQVMRAVPAWIGDECLRPLDVLARIELLEAELSEARHSRCEDEPAAAKPESAVPAPPAADPLAEVLQEHAKLRSTLENERLALESELAATRSDLQAARQLLEERTNFWEEARRQLQDELNQNRVELQRQVAELTGSSEGLREQVAQLTAKLEVDQASFESARTNWVTELDALEKQREAIAQRLAELEQQLAGERAEFDQALRDWSQERIALQSSLADEARRRVELEQEIERQAAQREWLAAHSQEAGGRRFGPSLPADESGNQTESAPADPLREQGSRTFSKSSSRRNELSWLAQQFAASESSSATSRLSGTESNPSDTAHEFRDAIPEDLDSTAATSDARAAVDCLPEGATDLSGHATMPLYSVRFLADWQPPLEVVDNPAQPLLAQEAGAIDAAGPNEGTEDNLRDSVLERLQTAGIWRSAPACEQGDRSSYRPSDATRAESSSEGKPSAAVIEPYPQQQTASDDDSIESYMQRLLERVRGTSGPATNIAIIAPVTEERSPLAELDTAPAEPEAPEERSLLDLDEYVPRSHPPELNADLAAMRELANDSSRQNILSHAQRTWSTKSGANLTNACAGFAVAIAAVFYFHINALLATTALLLGVGVGCHYICQAISLRRKLFDSLRLETETLHQDAEESSAATGV